MSAPFEIIVSPFNIYWAPTGEAFPDISDDPAGSWALIGTNGNLNYGEDGVVITHEQNVEVFRPDGATGPIKAARTEESLMIGLSLWDTTMEQYQFALNGNTVNSVAAGSGIGGNKNIGLARGADVTLMALLIRGVSPYDDTMSMQYEIPFAYESGSPEVSYNKSNVAALSLQFGCLVDPSAATPAERFGRLVAQDAAAT